LSTRLAAMPAKDNSPVHIANEIAKILEAPIADNSFKAELLKLRERVVYNWAMKSYQKTNEAGEDLAIEYILRKRKLYQEPSQHNTAINVNTVAQEPVNSVFEENEPGCLTINEVDYDEVLD